MKKIEYTAIVSVYGGVVQDIATNAPNVRFVLVDFDVEGEEPGRLSQIRGTDPKNKSDPAYVETFNPSPLDLYCKADRRVMGIDDCQTDGESQSRHEHGVSDCASPYQWRRGAVDTLEEEERWGACPDCKNWVLKTEFGQCDSAEDQNTEHDFDEDEMYHRNYCRRCKMDDNTAEFLPCPGKVPD